METPDFKRIFQSLGGCYLILMPNAPTYSIVAVSDAYLEATNTVRENIVGLGLFEVFPDNPNDKTADGVNNLSASLQRVLSKKAVDLMKVQKYDIRRSQDEDRGFEERYWLPDNAPILDDAGEVLYIAHHVTDVTSQEQLINKYGGQTHYGQRGGEQLTQLERLNKIMIDREVRMVELKKELNECRSIGAKEDVPQ